MTKFAGNSYKKNEKKVIFLKFVGLELEGKLVF